MATFRIITLGCKVNEYESRFYEEQLIEQGLRPAGEQEPADAVIINTCTVTNTAAAKSRRKVSRARRENPGAVIVVAGCFAQMSDAQAKEALHADLIIGAAGKKQLATLVAEKLREHQSPEEQSHRMTVDLTMQKPEAFEAMPIRHFEGQHRAFLKIQDGCNQYCAYCQIPLARGAERCADARQILETAKDLENSGHLEIVLTGIHTGRYKDPQTQMDLAGLLKALLKNTGDQVAYRISSIEITEVSDALIDLMKKSPRILPHLHIPVQAASNPTLARMKRPYTIEQFAGRIDEIRQAVPEIAISTDVITGFVQESEEEYAQTMHNLENLGFSFLHVFPYSRRKGTAADAMTGFVDPSEARVRAERLLELSGKLRKLEICRRIQNDQTFEVLIEREDPKHPGAFLGYTREYHPVSVILPDGLVSQRIRITPAANRSVLEDGTLQAMPDQKGEGIEPVRSY